MASTGSSSSALEPDASLRPADLVVAVTSHNDARSIGAVARAIVEGAGRSFESGAVRLLHADTGSTDGTREALREVIPAGSLVELPHQGGFGGGMPYHGDPGRAHALRQVLRVVQETSARACVVVDAAVQGITPEWVDQLAGPVLQGRADYVAPYFSRHAWEGALTRGIVYPFFRALYGVRLRQPAAREFGCSARLAAHVLEQDIWEGERSPAGVDLSLAAAAVCADFRVHEVALGARGTARAAQADLGTTIAQVVGALFADVERHVEVWQRIRGSTVVAVSGTPAALGAATSGVDPAALVESFRLGYRELREIWARALPPRVIVELRKLADTPAAAFRFDDRLWAGIVYDFALAFAFRVMPHDHLLRSLTPLYSAWLASLLLQVGHAASADLDARVEQVCQAFEGEKRYLISRWRWPERRR
ncbi:MAG: hypothetical protein FJW23_11090 [Acidimicrobiia bacterium]|nr:hypothetical protein [Acidimicrobiia bacterium]